uniref:Uncharacterized protein n=1 Tax=Alexandrium catenella TaxID=2925 RepID=A0A7S1RQF8_ALECA|mmetsp:Transcript_68203/g.181486  ORF Transcript_68203/g.181486 Transcript_68203/m.181486 type:complete len:245 (+) Transcript_68203:33-767(+)
MGPFQLSQAVYKAITAEMIAMAEEMSKAQPDEFNKFATSLERKTGDDNEELDRVLVHGMYIKYIEQGSTTNFTLKSNGCEILDSIGSHRCRVPLGSSIDFDFKMHLEANYEPGSRVEMKVQEPKIDGLLGMVAKNAFRKMGPGMTWSSPLCGPGASTVMVTKDENTMPDANCGHYSTDLIVEPHTFQMPSLETFHNFYMPGNTKFPEMALALIWTANTTVTMYHADGSIILDAIYEAGMVRARP